MHDLSTRLSAIEDRFALQDVLTRYCQCVDSLTDIDGLLDCFTEDVVFDLGGIGLPRFEGKPAIRSFFQQVFSDMTHHAHFNCNFSVAKLEQDRASCSAYVMGMGATHDGRDVLVYVRYALDYLRVNGVWKIKHFSEAVLMPLPDAVADIHAR